MEDMKANELMIRDWCCNEHGFPMQITNVGEDYAYATWEGNEGDPWEFDDKDDQPQPIVLTPEILKKNGFIQEDDADMDAIAYKCFCEILTGHYSANDIIVSYDGSEEFTITNDLGYPCDEITLYRPKVHELQHALRLCGLNELADNFKV